MSIQIPDSDEWIEKVVANARKRYLESLRRLQARYGNTAPDAVVDLDEAIPRVGADEVDERHEAVS